MAIAPEYTEALKQLLPPGWVYPRALEGTLHDTLSALAEELERVDLRVDGLISEADQRTSWELLTEWERVLAITAAQSDAAFRRRAVTAKLTELGGQSRAFFIALAETLGYTITITEYQPYTCESPVTDGIYGENVRYVWQVSKAGETIVTEATCMSPCTDPLRSWGEPSLEDEIRRRKPAHTTVIFGYPEWGIEGNVLGTGDGTVIGIGEDLGLAL